MNMKAIILARGGATRMEPLSRTLKKPLIPISEYPIALHIIRTILRSNITDIVIVIGPEDSEMEEAITIDTIKACCSEIQVDWNQVKLDFYVQEKAAGMADAVNSVRKFLLQADGKYSPFLLTAADIYFGENVPSDLVNHFKACNGKSVLAIASSNDDSLAESHGNVLIKEGKIVKIIEKPGKDKISNDYSMPMYVFTGELFNFLDKVQESSRGEKELQDAIQMMISHGAEVYPAKVLEDNIYTTKDAGKYHLTYPADILKMNFHQLKGIHSDYEGEYPTAMSPLAIYKATLGDNTFIGPFAIIHQGAMLNKFCEVQRTIVFNNATVGAHTKLRNCIVGPGAIVESNKKYSDKLFVLNESNKTEEFDLK
jgi:glucose-1-phosphate thymidylyltransferase